MAVASVLAFPATAFAQTSSAPYPPLKLKQMHPDFYVIDSETNNVPAVPNLIVYITPQGVLVVDPWFAKDYDHVVAAVKSVTDVPIRYVVNTHFHSDHTGANSLFPPSTEIIAQDNARTHMLQHAMPGPPNVTFKDELTIHLGDKQVVLRYLGPGHTDGDLAVYFPEWKTVCLGDMMAGFGAVTNPVVDYANGGNLTAWPSSLDRALAFDVTTVIPGHGTITDRAGLVAHRDKVAAVVQEMRTLDAEHKTKDEIQAALIKDFAFKPINLKALDGLISEFAAKP
jgi:cyclase